MPKKRSKLLDVAKWMPPCYHVLPGEEFDIKRSEVAKWLVQRPDILNYVVNRIKGSNGQSSYIVYNPSTGKWQGIYYEEDEDNEDN